MRGECRYLTLRSCTFLAVHTSAKMSVNAAERRDDPVDPALPVVPGKTVITNRADALDALVSAFVDGDPATSQRIVDELGARVKPSQCDADGLDWSS